MNGDGPKTLLRALLLQHATEAELVGWATEGIDPVGRARLEAHIELCSICHLRAERRRQEATEGTLPVPEGLWVEVRPGLRRLIEPIAVALGRLGALVQKLGTPALQPHWVGMTAGATEQGAADARQTRKSWLLEDPPAAASIQLSVETSQTPGAMLDVTAVLTSAQREQEARLEIVDEQGAIFLSGRLSKMAGIPARLPAGRWTLRVLLPRAGEVQGWEIPLHAQSGEVKS